MFFFNDAKFDLVDIKYYKIKNITYTYEQL